MGQVDRFDRKARADINTTSTGDITVITAPTSGSHIEIDFLVLYVTVA